MPDNPSYNPNFKVPCTAAWEYIKPDTARRMLAAGNRRNRRLVEGHVLRLKKVAARDEWMYDSTDAIGIASDGAVVNGQHRLEMIAQGRRGVWCLVVRGVRPSIINVIDQGSVRNLTQTLAIDGRFADSRGVSEAVQWAHRMINRHEKNQPQQHKGSVPELLDWLSDHPEIVDSLEPAKECNKRALSVRVGMFAAYHYAFSCADQQLADDFFEQLATGLEVEESDPVYVLRERLHADASASIDKKLKPWQIATFLVRAWEYTRAGQEISSKTFTKAPVTATQVPSVSDVDWINVDNSSADSDDEAA